MESRYSKFESDGSSAQDDDMEIKFTPNCAVEAYPARVFGTSSEYGQSLGTAFEEVALLDGALYIDPEKNVYKVFSWEDVVGLSPIEKYERGDEPSVDDAPDVETKKYGSTTKRYELVAARIEPIEDDGEVIIEEEAKRRDVDLGGDVPEFGDWEYVDGKIEVGDTITWWEANQEHGPSTSAQRVAQLLSHYGEDVIEDEDDWMNWLTDTTGDNMLRNDLRGRKVEFFLTTRTSENGFNYHVPVFIDTTTGAKLSPSNDTHAPSDSGNESGGQSGTGGGGGGESETITAAKDMDERAFPDPVADFIQTGERLSMTQDRAGELLNNLVEDGESDLTMEMVEEAGGEQMLVERVAEQ